MSLFAEWKLIWNGFLLELLEVTIRAVGQNAEVTWSHSGLNGKSNTLPETTAIISDGFLTMKCSKAVSQHAPAHSSSKSINITVRRGCNVSSADMMKSEWGISSCVTLLLQPGSWHETGCLSFSQPSQGTQHGHVCICVDCLCLIGYLSSNIPVRTGLSRSRSLRLRSEVWMPVSRERRQNGLKWRGGYCWGGH